jgi:hypothetical protein
MAQLPPAWLEYQRKRFTRPDGKLWTRTNGKLYLKPEPFDRKAWLERQCSGGSEGAAAPACDPTDWRDDPEVKRLVAEIKLDLLRRRYLFKFRPDQPRDDHGRWTDGGAGHESTVQPAFFDPRREIARKAIEAAVALYTWLSARNGSGRRAVIGFTARDYRPSETGGTDLDFVGQLDRDKVDAACPRLAEVQERTDLAAATVQRERGDLRPAQYGTAVHTDLKGQIDDLKDPNFRAEVSFLKERDDVRYGEKGSIRIDVFENVGNGTVCVYDIKTGQAGLTMPRTAEIATNVFNRYPATQRIIVTEVRPRR